MRVKKSKSLEEKEILRGFFAQIISNFIGKYSKNFLLDVAEFIKSIMNVDVCSFFLMEEDGKTLTLSAENGYIHKSYKDRYKKLIKKEIKYVIQDNKDSRPIKGEGITAWVARTGTSFTANSFAELKKHGSHAGKWDNILWAGKPEIHFKSLYAVPLKHNNKCEGVLKLENKKDFANRYISFSDQDKRILNILADVIANGIARAKNAEGIYLDIHNIIIQILEVAKEKYGVTGANKSIVNTAFKSSLDPNRLINNLAEIFRITPNQVKYILDESGLHDIVILAEVESSKEAVSSKKLINFRIEESKVEKLPFDRIFTVHFANPDINEYISADPDLIKTISTVVKNISDDIPLDPFLNLYRNNVMEYYSDYMKNVSPQIHEYIFKNFGKEGPRYLINSGIGANEMFNHFVSLLNNTHPERKLNWLICDAPKELINLPEDVTVENTLFMEFSRSGKTEETVKVHEFTPRNAKRIVFANRGSLRDVGLRDNNLVLPLPDEVSGRFGRNKTPILLAPMDVAGMDTKTYWKTIDQAIKLFDFNNLNSMPISMARYIYSLQLIKKTNFIYFGTNNNVLLKSADEMVQFWNEGTNKNGNDIIISRFLKLPRDSHSNLEAILANSETKMGIFMVHSKVDISENLHPIINRLIDPIDETHRGLRFGDEDIALAMANFKRFSEKMPTILIDVKEISLETSAILGQLWADFTYVYSRFKNVDPGSNPEVKFVRDRASELLVQKAREVRETISF